MKLNFARFLVVAMAFISVVLQIHADDEMKSLDNALKKELGIDETSNPNIKSTLPGNKSESTDEAKDSSNPVRDRYATEESGGSAIFLLLKVLLVFGGLTFLMIYILKVMAKTRNSRYPVQGKLSVLSSLPIGTNKQIQIVEVADKLLVLGVGDSSVNLLTEITDLEEKARIFKEKEEFSPSNENFLVTLLDTLKELKPQISSGGGKKEFSLSDSEDLDELEKRHQESLKRLQASRKELGLDSGGTL